MCSPFLMLSWNVSSSVVPSASGIEPNLCYGFAFTVLRYHAFYYRTRRPKRVGARVGGQLQVENALHTYIRRRPLQGEHASQGTAGVRWVTMARLVSLPHTGSVWIAVMMARGDVSKCPPRRVTASGTRVGPAAGSSCSAATTAGGALAGGEWWARGSRTRRLT